MSRFARGRESKSKAKNHFNQSCLDIASDATFFQVIMGTLAVCVLSISWFCNIQPAYAHSPHDVIRQIEVSPNFEEDQTLFVTVRGSLLKSTDGGVTWERPFKGLDNQQNFGGISIVSTSTVFVASEGNGIYRSEDYGDSWIKTNSGLNSLNIGLLCSPKSSTSSLLAKDSENRLYVTNDSGEKWRRVLESHRIGAMECAEYGDDLLVIDENGNFFVSEDNGESWTKSFEFPGSENVTAVGTAPSDRSSSLIFVGTNGGEIYQSSDNGFSFQKVEGERINDSIQSIQAVADDQANLTILISAWHGGFYASQDGGKTWEERSQGLTRTGQAEKDDEPHFSELEVSAGFQADGTIFLAGFDGLFKTTDKGNSWQQLYTLSPRAITSLSISPNYGEDATLAVGSYKNEAYISQDAGESWRLINSGLTKVLFNRYGQRALELHRARFYNLSFSPSYHSDNTLFSVLNYYFFKSSNAGKTWKESRPPAKKGYSQRGRFMAVSPAFENDQTVYLVTRYGGLVYQSVDGGGNFTTLGAIDQDLNSLAISPNYKNDKTLYASGAAGIYKTTDSGETWLPTTQEKNLGAETWFSVAISPGYEADRTVFAGSDRGLFKTQDAGETWEIAEDSLPGNSADNVKVVALSPNYALDQTVIIGVQGKGVFKSTDAGKTFQPIGQELQERNIPLLPFEQVPTSSASIQFSPAYKDDKTIFAFGSASAEVFKSTDSGNTWQIIAIEKQPNRLDDALLVGLALSGKSLEAYPRLRFIPALLGAIATYFIVGKGLNFLKLLNKTNRWRSQLFCSVLGFVLIVGLLSILF